MFVDFTKAYDSVDEGVLFQILKAFKIPDKLIGLIKAAIQISKLRVSVGNYLTEEIAKPMGLKKEKTLSSMLFNLTLDTSFEKF